MRAVVVGLIALALVSAGGAAYLVYKVLDGDKKKVVTQGTEVPIAENSVLVADNDMAAGAKVGGGDLRWQPWPEDALRGDFIKAPKDAKKRKGKGKLVGKVARHWIPKGTPVTETMVFARDNPGFLAGALDPGKRAVAVSVTAASGAAGFILPGDRVDVILTHDIRRDFSNRDSATPVIGNRIIRHTAETILQDVRVLAVDQKFDDFDKEAAVVKTVTLEVDPKHAETLIVANVMGKISLVLRSLADGGATSPKPTFTTDLEVSPTLAIAFARSPRPAPPIVIAALTPPRRAAGKLEGLPKAPPQAKAPPVAEKKAPPKKVAEPVAEKAPPKKAAAKPAVKKVAKKKAPPKKAVARPAVKKKPKVVAVSREKLPPPPKVAVAPAAPAATRRSGYLAGILATGTRAVAVPVTAASGAAGFIQPGDRVDVILTQDVRKDAEKADSTAAMARERVVRYSAETILEDIRVLAVDQKFGTRREFGTLDEDARVAKTVTLQLRPQQAEILAVANVMGAISLSLRGPAADLAGATRRPFTTDVQVSRILAATLGKPRAAVADTPPPSVAAPPPKARPGPAPRRVRVIRAGQASSRAFPGR